MTNRKTTRRTLLASALSLLLCVSMLIGTTYAWFTDTVTSGKNRIVAGNLDVELEYAKPTAEGGMTSWATVDGTVSLFPDTSLWEPGHTEVVYLKVSNLGTLALSYKLAVTVVHEEAGTSVTGGKLQLSDYLEFAQEISEEEPTGISREAAQAFADKKGTKLKTFSDENVLYAADKGISEQYITLIVYMPESVGNEANYLTGTAAPYIDLDITLLASQATVEKDSFDESYDKDAVTEIDRTVIQINGTSYAVSETFANSQAYKNGKLSVATVICADDMAALSAMDQAGMVNHSEAAIVNITIGADIDMAGKTWTALNGHFVNIIGDGHTISNLNCLADAGGRSGLIGYGGGSHITDLTLKNVTAAGNQAGAFIANADDATITGCKLAGRINVSYRNANSSEEYNCVGLVAGIAQGGRGSDIQVDIADVISCTLNDAGMESKLNGTPATHPYVWHTTDNSKVKLIGLPWDGTTVDTAWYDKNASEFTLYTAEEFAGFSQLVSGTKFAFNDKTVTLGADINLGGNEWTPIGYGEIVFTGTLDGNGHTISGLKITSDYSKDPGRLGMFSRLHGKATVKDLTIDGAVISGVNANASKAGYVGVLAGSSMSNVTGGVENVRVTNATITGVTTKYLGGLIGQGYTNLTNCYFQGEISPAGAAQVGGIIGLPYGVIDHCYTDVVFDGKYTVAGGIVGFGNNVTIKNCYATGSIFQSSGFYGGGNVGGIVGYGGATTVENCYCDAKVDGGQMIVANCGDVENTFTVENCSWTGGDETYTLYGASGQYTVARGDCTFTAGMTYAEFAK